MRSLSVTRATSFSENLQSVLKPVRDSRATLSTLSDHRQSIDRPKQEREREKREIINVHRRVALRFSIYAYCAFDLRIPPELRRKKMEDQSFLRRSWRRLDYTRIRYCQGRILFLLNFFLFLSQKHVEFLIKCSFLRTTKKKKSTNLPD